MISRQVKSFKDDNEFQVSLLQFDEQNAPCHTHAIDVSHVNGSLAFFTFTPPYLILVEIRRDDGWKKVTIN